MINRPIMGLDKAFKAQKPIKTEPWMDDFVKGRHTQEEWDAFFAYCEAGPFKRWLSRVAGFLVQFIPGLR